MGDMMTFPKRWEDFLHDYEFEDARRIYTNGSRLILSFRVKQMMEHYAQVRHGRWIEYTKVIVPEPYNKWEQAWKCSECGFDDGFIAYSYCPNCGARMATE